MGTLYVGGDAMREYPTSTMVPSRKMRKSQRKKIFQENSEAFNEARKARREAKRKANG